MRTRRQLVRSVSEDVELREAASIDLPRPAAEVWEFMWDPANTGTWRDDVERGVTLPGTPPREVGEIQVFVGRDEQGRTTLTALEVLAVEVGRSAVTRTVTSGAPVNSGTLTVDPLDAGSCRLTQEFRVVVPAGTLLWAVESTREAQRTMMATLMRRLSDALT